MFADQEREIIKELLVQELELELEIDELLKSLSETGKQLSELGRMLESPNYIDESSLSKFNVKIMLDPVLIEQRMMNLMRLRVELDEVKLKLNKYRLVNKFV